MPGFLGSEYSVVYASAARTAAPTAYNVLADNATSLYLVVNLTAFVTAANLFPVVSACDTDGNVLFDMLTAPAITGTGLNVYHVGAGLWNGSTAGPVTMVRPHALTDRLQVSMFHGNANSHTYTVGLYLVRN